MTLVYNALPREEARILSQLRTGHTALNECLARIRAEQSASCACRMGAELIQHFLFYCPKWRSERTQLRETMGDGWGDLTYALGGWSGRRDGRNGCFVVGPRERWKPYLKIIKAIIQYVIKTGRFQPKATVGEEIEVADVVGVVEETEIGKVTGRVKMT